MQLKGVSLKSINRILLRLGLVMVIQCAPGAPHRLWIERVATFNNRCGL